MALRQQGRSAPVAPIRFARQVVAAKIDHHLFREQVALAIAVDGRMAELLVGRRIDEQLERNRRPARIARHEGDRGGEIAARAIATDSDLF